MKASPTWQALVQSGPVDRLAAALNAVPLPYHRLPLTVRGQVLAADSLDRFLYLVLAKLCGRDSHLLDLLADLCRPGQYVADVGANLGLYALVMARAVGPGGAVLVVEPDPDNHRLLLENLAANACPQVTAVRAMAGADAGEGTLYRSASNRGDHVSFPAEGRAGVPVARRSLDDLVPQDQEDHFVKLDVQGYEGHVLEGMGRVLARSRSLRLLTEFWPHGLARAGYPPAAFLARLESLGFSFRIADAGSRRLIPADAGTVLAAAPGRGYIDILCEREA